MSKAKERHKGGGQTHNPFKTKPHSPFWLRGMLYCDKCGSRLVGNSTATTKVHGGQKYYLCGGYMRKGKAFCPYVGWRKETLENLVSNKLRAELVRIILNDRLEEELMKYKAELNQRGNQSSAELEAEIQFLNKRIKQMEQELADGRGRAYYSDAISEMKQELHLKEAELTALSPSFSETGIPEQFMVTLEEGIRRLITLLEDDSLNPQSLHESVPKFISNVSIHRETKNVHITFQIKSDEEVLYQKILVVEWPRK
jgi:site-specific DNA recombinase